MNHAIQAHYSVFLKYELEKEIDVIQNYEITLEKIFLAQLNLFSGLKR